MTNQQILRPTRKEVVEKANRGNPLDSRDLLHLKSRSFAYPIDALWTLKGEDESDKRIIIQNLYNWLRELDEAEDGYIPIGDKLKVIGDISHIANEVIRIGSSPLEDLIHGPLKNVTETMLRGHGRFSTDEETRIFIEQFGNGPVLKELQGILANVEGNPKYEDVIKNLFRDSVNTMGNGMRNALESRELISAEDFERYCDYVAGIIGEKTTYLVRELDGVEDLNSADGKALGKLLQTTNITKNIREDADVRADYSDARTFFIPRDFYEQFGINSQELVRGPGKEAKEAREEVFETLRTIMESYRPASVDYIKSIPQRVSGYKAFCLIPYITAEATWNRMRRARAEKIFAGEEDAVKISTEEFKNIIQFTHSIIRSGNVNEWLTDFSERPKNYSFVEGDGRTKYNAWVNRWLERAA